MTIQQVNTAAVSRAAKALAASVDPAKVQGIKAAAKAKQQADREARDASNSPEAIRARGIVAAWTEGAKALKDAMAQVEVTKKGQLARLQDASKGMPEGITPEEYDAAYHEHVKASLLASGAMDAKTVPMAASRIKTALVGLLNGVAPLASDTSVKAYCDRARPALVKKGLIEDRSAGDNDGRKAKASSDKTLKAAAFLLAGKNEARAQRLLLVLTPEYVAAFDTWSHETITSKAAMVKAKAKKTATPAPKA